MDIAKLKTVLDGTHPVTGDYSNDAELAALDDTKAGGRANVSGAGSALDHVGYKDGLYRELESLNGIISKLEGPFEVTSDVIA